MKTLSLKLPGRVVIWLVAVRRACLRVSDRIEAAGARLERVWHVAMPWITGAALALGLALVQAWLEQEDLRVSLEAASRAHREAVLENHQLKARIAEINATRTTTLFWLIEGGSSEEVRDKLQRVAVLVGQQYFATASAVETFR